MKSFRYPTRLIAHRGGGTLAPENTLAGIRMGYQSGCRAVEFDVMLSADQIPVLMHDDKLNRTTNAKGPLPSKTAEQLAFLDAGAWHSPVFTAEPVPSFANTVRLCQALKLFVNAEIKPYAPGGEQVAIETGRQVALACLQYWGKTRLPLIRQRGHILLSSFSIPALEAAAKAAPTVPLALLVNRVPSNWQETVSRLACVALHVNGRYMTEKRVQAIKSAGYGLMCWTINNKKMAQRLLEWGCDAICTDRPDLLRDIL